MSMGSKFVVKEEPKSEERESDLGQEAAWSEQDQAEKSILGKHKGTLTVRQGFALSS